MRKHTGHKILLDQDYFDPLSVQVDVGLPPPPSPSHKIEQFKLKTRSFSHTSHSPFSAQVSISPGSDHVSSQFAQHSFSNRHTMTEKKLGSSPKRAASSPLQLENNGSDSSLVTSFINSYKDMGDSDSYPANSDSEHSLFSLQTHSSKESLPKADFINTYSKPLPSIPIETFNQADVRDYNLSSPRRQTHSQSPPKPKPQPKKHHMAPPDTTIFTRKPTYIRKQHRSPSDQAVRDAGIEPFMLGGYQPTKTLKIVN
ncbi:hypothetical protein KL918_001522 [Ogataea parapolymorpha]|uniref:Uncharacterized protein n=1 Tax=Ogataea parapolymorpha (strain ATCC 26012 / BCRC 20466 / JCM 22074 / NRRL Y-7560 / DL-1) TaxID=871575 RepID=W1QGT0_OGAPD|nr:hypothetical protein HPODL_03431 [Ogataea parapolymorpha DL-1]ESW99545.1 hypothetical protein HPODL_03431 [Ogataea parapolymorpha DL-1]KAG7868879.1 hypothetical protein KL918_001522 [Ogataea parapolymorpha]KAG7873960.1 hypothetical protein KL916_001734 [Ogataea parapolymorpha]